MRTRFVFLKFCLAVLIVLGYGRSILLADMQVQFSLEAISDSIYDGEEARIALKSARLSELGRIDFTLRYDSNIFEFLGFTPVDSHLKVTSENQSDGIRLTLEGIGANDGSFDVVGELRFRGLKPGYSDLILETSSAIRPSGELLSVTPFYQVGLLKIEGERPAEESSYLRSPGDLGDYAYSNPDPDELVEESREAELSNPVSTNQGATFPQALPMERQQSPMLLIVIILVLAIVLILLIILLRSWIHPRSKSADSTRRRR
ncbi:MAG: cohesin domain-containing protein [Eubacteriales bacterium]|nr:cohesin domain-containing protein [Eubacteriales bacterium]